MKRFPLMLATLSLVAGCGDSSTTLDAAAIDMATTTTPGDMASAKPDLATSPDMARPSPDLATPPDLASSPDLATAVDMTVPPDLAGPLMVVIFTDDYGPGISFAPFGGSNNNVTVDMAEHHTGTASLKIVVPNGGYTGGAMKSAAPQDLTSFTAVTFWAKASKNITFDTFGFGNNAMSAVLFGEWHAAPITTNWTKFYLPLPLPAKLTAQDGLFHFAQGGNGPYTVWLDDIQYETVSAMFLGAPAPAIATETINRAVGDTFDVNGSSVNWMINAMPVTLAVGRPWFAWATSNPQVASVDANGHVIALGAGTTKITAKLGAIDAAGVTTINVTLPMAPQAPPPRPNLPAANVISLLSNAYVNVPVTTWSAQWGNAMQSDVKIGGDDMKKYAALVFAGIEFTAPTIDASQMTAFHLDVWTPDATLLKIKLVDFGADGKFGGGDDTEHELIFDANSNPKLVTQAWMSLDLPFTLFVNLKARAHLAQLIISGSNSTLYVDNVYFHK